MPRPKHEPDFLVADYGSMVALTPISADANKACDVGLIDYEDWQLQGATIMVDHRVADDLICRLKDDGFAIAAE
jgi:hypothetical protein